MLRVEAAPISLSALICGASGLVQERRSYFGVLLPLVSSSRVAIEEAKATGPREVHFLELSGDSDKESMTMKLGPFLQIQACMAEPGKHLLTVKKGEKFVVIPYAVKAMDLSFRFSVHEFVGKHTSYCCEE